MESSSSTRPRNLRSPFQLFTSITFALAAVVFLSVLVYRTLSATVESEVRTVTFNTQGRGRYPTINEITPPHRTDQPDRMAAANVEQRWAHFVGQDAEEAKKKIQEDHPQLKVVVVPEDSFITMDYNTARVRIFKDANQKVVRAPKRG